MVRSQSDSEISSIEPAVTQPTVSTQQLEGSQREHRFEVDIHAHFDEQIDGQPESQVLSQEDVFETQVTEKREKVPNSITAFSDFETQQHFSPVYRINDSIECLNLLQYILQALLQQIISCPSCLFRLYLF